MIKSNDSAKYQKILYICSSSQVRAEICTSMTTTESKEQRYIDNYCFHPYTNKLVQALLLEDPFMYYHLAHMLRFVVLFLLITRTVLFFIFCDNSTYTTYLSTYSFVVFPYLEARK